MSPRNEAATNHNHSRGAGGNRLRCPIHDAARDGDLAGVQAALDKGADLNTKAGLGWTPLHFAQ